MKKSCVNLGLNRGHLVCETSVMTNYTTQTYEIDVLQLRILVI